MHTQRSKRKTSKTADQVKVHSVMGWIFAVFFTLFTGSVFSAPGIQVSVSNVDTIDLGTWDGSAIFSANDDICVARAAGTCGGGCPYTVRAQGGAYEVTNGIDIAPFRVFYNDQAGVSGNQELVFKTDLPGQSGIFSPTCSGVNGNFQIVFDGTGLNPLSPGVYTGSFRYRFDLDNVKSKRAQGPVDVSLTIPDVVQITGLNDIPLALSGLLYQGGDDFCVYRNGAGGTYSVTATSANSAGPGLFTLVSGAGSVNYDVYFDDAPGATSASTALTEGANNGGYVGTNIYNSVCSAVNASIYIESATSNFLLGGSYSDTLTMTIMPE